MIFSKSLIFIFLSMKYNENTSFYREILSATLAHDLTKELTEQIGGREREMMDLLLKRMHGPRRRSYGFRVLNDGPEAAGVGRCHVPDWSRR